MWRVNVLENERGLRYFPIALFASVMGLAGTTFAVQQYELMYDLMPVISVVLFTLTILIFIIIFSIFLYRVITYPNDIKAELNHPVKMNFFGAISISLLMIGLIFYDVSETISFITWALGAIIQLILTLFLLTGLMWKQSLKIEQFNPVWFIPIVGNIVVPLAGVYHVGLEINIFYFSLGIIFSIIYFTLFMNRMFFKGPLPDMLRPTVFILLAPPAIGFMSYVKIFGQASAFAFILYGLAFYLGLLFLYQIKHYLQVPFFVSWWAMLFPTAAMTNATFVMYELTGLFYLKWLIHLQILGLFILAIYLIVRTIGLNKNKQLCVKE